MMDWVRRNPIAAILAVLVAVLGAWVAAEATLGSQSAVPSAAGRHPAPAEAKLLPPVVATAADQAYPETVARPLFIPTRRPAPEAPNAGRTAFQKGQFVLQGVIAVGSQRIAMLREKSSGKIHRVEAGNDVNGIKVSQIDPEEVTLTMGPDREVLPLLVQKAATGPGAPAAAPAASGPFMREATQGQPSPPATPVPGQPFAPPLPLVPGQQPNPMARQPMNPGGINPGGAAPLTPEELLARRRARRTPSGQQPQ
ncbi:MAG TPA: hypothetical protein VH301_16805 [Usitatibacter sp.]|jgi:hypothetical protein|nr:hypothetical protein [Usitatibacter sp.]